MSVVLTEAISIESMLFNKLLYINPWQYYTTLISRIINYNTDVQNNIDKNIHIKIELNSHEYKK